MTLGIVAIVRNEADQMDAIARWLDVVPAERWTICDTGSTDGTASLIEGLGATVHRDEWLNFGHNRSLAFGRARGTADWLLAVDADMTLDVGPYMLDPSIDAYTVQMGSEDFSYRLPLVLRGDLPWESRGAVHEYTCLPDRDYVSRPTDAIRVSYAHDRSSAEKSRWHATLLEAELAKNPNDTRTIFYLAQTYRDLGDARALALYRRRAEMGGWAEETFYAKYRYATLLPSWPARLLALIDAWEFRPERLEPVHELARELNYRGQHQAALRFASVPVLPTNDILFVHNSVWDWGMDFERSIAEWWAGDRDECARLSQELLGNPRVPGNVREAILRNLEFCRAA